MKINYKPEIDGLRALAVLSVILYHAEISFNGSQFFKGGFLGVDIFFVISGYLISSIIMKELSITGKFSYMNFYERRIRRLLPVFILVIVISFFASWYLLLSHRLIDFSESAISSIFFSSNIYFHYSGLRYGAVGGLFQPLLHTWSLSIEEQFYLFFPIVFICLFHFLKKNILLFLLLGFFISLIFAEWASINHHNFNFYMLPSRGWELLAGTILAYLKINLKLKSKQKIFNEIFCTIGLLLITYSILVLFKDGDRHPSFLTLIPIIGTCLIIFFSEEKTFISKILSNKIIVGIGMISYSLYLWHYPIFVFSRIDDGKYFNLNKIELIVITFILSIISYFLIEQPARERNLINIKKLLSIICIGVFSIILMSISVINQKGYPSRHHKFLNLTKFSQDHKNFEMNYNYDNFSQKKNILIIGNSVAEDLQRILHFSDELNQKFYPYIFSPKKREWAHNYQLECFKKFLINKITKCRRIEFTDYIHDQYNNADIIIFASHKTDYKNLIEIIDIIKKDKKDYLVYVNDFFINYKNNLNRLDNYIFKNNKLPSNSELEQIENQIFNDSLKYEDLNKLDIVKNKFKDNKIKFVSRRELFCNLIDSKCKILTNNFDKIYRDHIHFTELGSKYFSENFAKYLLNNFNN